MKRRDFVKKIAGAGLIVGFPTIIPSSALGKDGAVAPSRRVTMGAIGLGTQGSANIKVFASDPRVQVVGLCDVNATDGKQFYGYGNNEQRGLQVARKNLGMDIPCYNDFRELIARKDVDTVMIAVPDHWHAVLAMACIAAGKDVYGEKPLTRTIREGITLRDAVLSSGRIWQTGSWQRSLTHFVNAAETVRNGYLGKVRRIVIGLPSNFKAEILKPVPVPKGFDWEMWQGPAPRVDYYNPCKTFTRWRGVMNYSSGKISDWGAHFLDFAHWAIGMEESGPDEIIPNYVEWPTDGFSDQPTKFRVTFRYRNGVEIDMSDMNRQGVEFTGEKGSFFVTRGSKSSYPIELCDKRILPTEDRLFPVRFGDHFSAFIDSVLDRRRTVTDIEVAHRTNTGCLLGEIAYRLNRTIKWNPASEKIVGDEQAERLCDRAYCPPWELRV